MKKLVLTFVVIFTSLSFAWAKPDNGSRNLFVGVVIDGGPSNSKAWNIKKLRIAELLSSLNQGDKVVVLKARSGSPYVCGKTVIGGPEKTGSNEIVSCVSGLGKELLSSANVAGACESVYDIFVSEGEGLKCLLVVLTNGKLSSDQVQRIVRTSSQIKTLGGFTCLTYDPAVARQDLINVSNKNDIDMLVEANPSLANLIKSKRDEFEDKKIIEKEPEYVFVEPNLTPIKTMIDKAITSLKSDTSNSQQLKTIELPQAKEVHETNIPAEVNTEPQGVEQTQARSISWLLWILITSAVIMVIAMMMIYVIKSLRKTDIAYDDDEPHQPSCLKATVGEQDIDLGEVGIISELSVGSDPGCSIFVEDDQLSPQQARIFRTPNGFKLQNLDSEPVIVNGLEVKNKKKVKLDMPADIQLPNGMILNLFTEAIPEIKDDDND